MHRNKDSVDIFVVKNMIGSIFYLLHMFDFLDPSSMMGNHESPSLINIIQSNTPMIKTSNFLMNWYLTVILWTS